MKSSLPLKLGIAVVLLFAVVITTCLLWTPVKIRYYMGKLESNDPKERVAGVEELFGMGDKGWEIILDYLPGGNESATLLHENWSHINGKEPVKYSKPRKAENVLMSSYHGRTYIPVNAPPIHKAVELDDPVLIELLISKGADPDIKVEYTVGHWSGENGGGTVSTRFTPLHLSIRMKKIKALKALIRHGANQEARTGKEKPEFPQVGGFRALHMAAADNSRIIAGILVSNGVDINGFDINGDTPLDTAIYYRKDQMIEFLRAHGAKTGEELRRSTKYRVPSTGQEEKK